jgi:hypothetical protein
MVLKAFSEVLVGPSKFNLLDLENFPYDTYEEQWAEYSEAERWFTGAALNDQPENAGKSDLYPMRVNPIVSTVLKHAYVLFGEVEDDARALVIPKLQYNPKKAGQKEQAEEAEEALNMIWWENHGRAVLIENAVLSQIYGGCVLKATYVPWEWIEYEGDRSIPIRIEGINPKNFVGIPDASDNYKLLEAWVLKEIDLTEARLWGWQGTWDDTDDPMVWYIEHWTTTTYEVLIDGKIATRMVNGEPQLMSGPNPFGFIPMVYIPHIRVGSFRGVNAYSHLVGMIKELNARWGDYGDAVNDDSHPVIAGKNVQGSVQVKRVTNWLEYVDLGSNPGISGNEPEPDLFQVNQQRASPSMENMVKGIYQQYRRDSFVPPVADGEDEGSQRSGMTLAIRFWPLTSHAGTERYFWTPGLDVFHRMLLRMMVVKGLAEITVDHLRMRIKEKWAPFLPRDREAEVQEWAIRSSNTIASVEHLIDMAADVEDVTEERQRILQWIKDVEIVKQKALADATIEIQENQQDADADMQEDQLVSQEKVAKTQADAFKSQPKPTASGAKPSRPPQRGGAK